MTHTFQAESQAIDFNFNEAADCWQAKAIIDDLEIKIEIDFLFHRDKEIDWEHFAKFFKLISQKGQLTELIDDSEDLVNELGKAFYRKSKETSEWRMDFTNSIYYNGKTGGAISGGYAYSLIFNFSVHKDNKIWGDEYGNYLVDVENFAIVGTRRIQC